MKIAIKDTYWTDHTPEKTMKIYLVLCTFTSCLTIGELFNVIILTWIGIIGLWLYFILLFSSHSKRTQNERPPLDEDL